MAGAFIVAITALFKRREPEFDPDDPDNWTGLDYVHERVLEQLGRQEARWKEIDDRLRFLLGVIGVIFAAGGVFMRSAAPAGSDPSAGFLPFWVGMTVIVAVCLFLISGAMAAWAHRPRNFDRPRSRPGCGATT